MKVDIHLIIPNPQQPRTVFDQEELEGLAQSIRENDLIQPIVVEQADDHYILVDGERRWRACQLAGMKQIEVVVRPATNGKGIERLTKALVANIQRSAMGPVDEARAYQKLITQFGSANAVAKKVGVSHATVSTKLYLLEFPEPVQKLFNLGRLPMDARVINGLKALKTDTQLLIATRAATRGLSGSGILRMISMHSKARKRQAKQPVLMEPEPVLTGGHFNALAMINGKKLPDHIRVAAIATCKACALYPEASPVMCRECPLPDFLRRVEAGKEAS